MKKSLIFLLIWVPLICFVAYKYLPKPAFNMGILGETLWLKEKFFPSKEETKPDPCEDNKVASYFNADSLQFAYQGGVRDATADIVKNLVYEKKATINYNGKKYKVTVTEENVYVDRNFVGVVGDNNVVVSDGNTYSEADGTRPSGNDGEIQ